MTSLWISLSGRRKLAKPLRHTLNLEAGDEVELIDKNGYVMIRKS
jgi:bifunctional DNA-binding transcriptional regulator/antitoxin component of YhaV-PrlF toxin-antitoxin module